jgi:regulator of protease activity HflC (stomatin/prohibitin superfamily)
MDAYLYTAVAGVFVVVAGALSIRILREYERGVVFRLGRVIGAKGPGLFLLVPIIDRMVKVSLRVQTYDVAPQDIITRDTVSVKVNAVLMFRVVEPVQAIVAVRDFVAATGLLAQTTLRSVLGGAELDELLSERERLNEQLHAALASHAGAWGVQVLSMDVKHVDLPDTMRRAMARQAEAERERQAKIVAAEGEFQAAETLRQAATILGRDPVALQLRYLQTLVEIAAEQQSTTVFPVPISLTRPFPPPPDAGEDGR